MNDDSFQEIISAVHAHPTRYWLRASAIVFLARASAWSFPLTALLTAGASYVAAQRYPMAAPGAAVLAAAALVVAGKTAPPLLRKEQAYDGVLLSLDRHEALRTLLRDCGIAGAGVLLIEEPQLVVIDPRDPRSPARRPLVLLGAPLLCALEFEGLRAMLHREVFLWKACGALLARADAAELSWLSLIGALAAEDSVWTDPASKLAQQVLQQSALLSAAVRWNASLLADAHAASTEGTERFALALCRQGLTQDLLQTVFWPALREEAQHTPAPSPMPFSAMRTVLRNLPKEARPITWNREGFEVPLRDRLHALDVPFREELPSGYLAAGEALFGAEFSELLTELDHHWWERSRAGWTGVYDTAQRSAEAVTSLEALKESRSLTLDEERLLASTILSLEGPEKALPTLRALHARAPGDAQANLLLGRALLRLNDDTGRDFLERAMTLDEQLTSAACGLLAREARARGADAEARSQIARAVQWAQQRERANMERRELQASVQFLAHGLPAEVVEAITRALVDEKRIGRAFLVRRVVQELREEPCYVLVLEARGPWYRIGRLRDAEALRSLSDVFVAAALGKRELDLRVFTAAEVPSWLLQSLNRAGGELPLERWRTTPPGRGPVADEYLTSIQAEQRVDPLPWLLGGLFVVLAVLALVFGRDG